MPLVVKSVSVFRDVSVLVFECLFGLFLCLLLKVLCFSYGDGGGVRTCEPRCSQRPEEGASSPGAGVACSCELLSGCLETHLGCLQCRKRCELRSHLPSPLSDYRRLIGPAPLFQAFKPDKYSFHPKDTLNVFTFRKRLKERSMSLMSAAEFTGGLLCTVVF